MKTLLKAIAYGWLPVLVIAAMTWNIGIVGALQVLGFVAACFGVGGLYSYGVVLVGRYLESRTTEVQDNENDSNLSSAM